MVTNLWKTDGQKGRGVNFCDGEAATDLVTLQQISPGWIEISDGSWTYASASTITVDSITAALLQIGDRIRWKNPSSYRYAYVTGISGTTVTINAGSDYTVANATIASAAISKAINPTGFPQWFNWTPTFAGFSADPTSVVAKFCLLGKLCHVAVRMGASGTSNATNFTVSAPITAATVTNAYWGNSLWGHVDNGTLAAQPGVVSIVSAGTVFDLYTTGAAAAWTGANGKRANFTLFYEV